MFKGNMNPYTKEGLLFTVKTQQVMIDEGWSEAEMLEAFKGVRDHKTLGLYLKSLEIMKPKEITNRASLWEQEAYHNKLRLTIKIYDSLLYAHLSQGEIDLLPFLQNV